MSGISEGSVLEPVHILLYANDQPDRVSSNVYMFVDYSKIFHYLTFLEDTTVLQYDFYTKFDQQNGSSILNFTNAKLCLSQS